MGAPLPCFRNDVIEIRRVDEMSEFSEDAQKGRRKASAI